MDDHANGDISVFPKDVFEFFGKKGSTTLVVNPRVLQEVVGDSTIPLDKYDVYVMGKKLGDNRPSFFTKMRIEGRAQARNKIQGFLGIRFLAGYGFQKVHQDSSLKIMRPTDIQKLVTQDSASFKKRAIIRINDGVGLSLAMTEAFCKIPLLNDTVLDAVDTKANMRKREAYARKRAREKNWAHLNRESTLNENHVRMHRMLLPYKRNLPDGEYFQEFLRDIVRGCLRLQAEFCPEDQDKCRKIFSESFNETDETENRQRPNKRPISVHSTQSLLDMPIQGISW